MIALSGNTDQYLVGGAGGQQHDKRDERQAQHHTNFDEALK